MGMAGRKVLCCIDRRLRQINSQNGYLFFGEINMHRLGYFVQLPPVIDSSMFNANLTGGPLILVGRFSFKSFNKSAVLTTIERVHRSNELEFSFRHFLSNLRNGCVTQSDPRLLLT